MKDSRYIELLNLYVDREITPAEAAELEAEVQRGGERRRVFLQYCRMDQACTQVLAHGGAVPAPKLAAALAAADDNVAELPVQAGGRSKLVFFGGLMAAAAAVAVVFFNRGASPMPVSQPSVAQSAPQVTAPASPAPRAAVTGREATIALTSAASTVVADRPSLAWLQQMDLPRAKPISEEDLKLIARSEKPFSSGLTWSLHRESAAFPKAGMTRPATELNAFEVGK